jgi:hypothetical protein
MMMPPCWFFVCCLVDNNLRATLKKSTSKE